MSDMFWRQFQRLGLTCWLWNLTFPRGRYREADPAPGEACSKSKVTTWGSSLTLQLPWTYPHPVWCQRNWTCFEQSPCWLEKIRARGLSVWEIPANYHTITTLSPHWTALFPIKGLDTAPWEAAHTISYVFTAGHLLLPFLTGVLTFVIRQCSFLPPTLTPGNEQRCQTAQLRMPQLPAYVYSI